MVLESSADVPPQSGRKTGTKVQVFFLFVTYSIIQDIISSEMSGQVRSMDSAKSVTQHKRIYINIGNRNKNRTK